MANSRHDRALWWYFMRGRLLCGAVAVGIIGAFVALVLLVGYSVGEAQEVRGIVAGLHTVADETGQILFLRVQLPSGAEVLARARPKTPIYQGRTPSLLTTNSWAFPNSVAFWLRAAVPRC